MAGITVDLTRKYTHKKRIRHIRHTLSKNADVIKITTPAHHAVNSIEKQVWKLTSCGLTKQMASK